MKRGSILIVDDKVQILNSLSILLRDEFQTIDTIPSPKRIPEFFRSKVYDIVLLDMNFAPGDSSGNEGIFWLREILKLDSRAVVIMITAYGDIELAVKAIKLGATDFITKPWDTEELLITLRNAYHLRRSKVELDHLKEKQNQLSRDIDTNFRMITGSSARMSEIINTVGKVARTEANILILGENGTGKELIAREIHRNSKRHHNVFIAVDVASLSESLFESEMFGHIKGAFTDAKEDRAGRIEVAHGGTLFLDEIGNLSLPLQAKLLQVIQSRQVTRVGSSRPVPVDIRLITATNKPIMEMVKENTFREDLYYRLNTIRIELPSLRERSEDIPYLAEAFLKEYGRKYDKPFLKLTARALDKLCTYPWPGNVRELKHTIEKAVILSEGHLLNPEDLYLHPEAMVKSSDTGSSKLEDVERDTIERVIGECRGNYSRAAKILDISRTTLYAKIKKYGIQ
ncbi:MAG: sigma-54-dependent Fis family transcriptional regulator [Bacteroidales bacterium]|nr:MAG: sigma-54-dependent Fis family transcriptional regulator [Bacteroidales bacterium]